MRQKCDSYNHSHAHERRAPRGLPLVLRVEGPQAAPVRLARPARLGPLDAAQQRGHAAADAVLPRPRDAPGSAPDDRPKGLPHPGYRRGRARHVPPDLLRDARQLLVRSVLQGRRDRPRMGVRLRSHEGRSRQVLGHRVRRRSGARARRGRGGGPSMGGERLAAGAHHPARPLAQLLVGRRPRPLRAGHRALLRPRRGDRVRPPDLCARLRVRTLPRVLEPRLHGVRAARGRLGHAASEAERRHRHGPRAGRDDPAGGDRDLRHRRLPGDHELDRRGERRRVRRLGGRDQGAPDPRRPRPRDDVPRRRRRHAVERGPRLRAAPHHPAGPSSRRERSASPTSGGSPTSSSTRWATGTRSSSRTAR